MSRGDEKAAIALLDSDDHSGAPIGLDMPLVSEDPLWTVCDELLKKHPKGQPAYSAALKSLDGCGPLNCPTRGYPTLRHNELRDFTAEILSEVCVDVCIKPPLQPLSGETLTYATANVEDGARLDISAAGFWGGQHQKAYFDVKVFNLNASSYRGSQVSSLYHKFEKDKRRKYKQRI